jgi:hypothetical protein
MVTLCVIGVIAAVIIGYFLPCSVTMIILTILLKGWLSLGMGIWFITGPLAIIGLIIDLLFIEGFCYYSDCPKDDKYGLLFFPPRTIGSVVLSILLLSTIIPVFGPLSFIIIYFLIMFSWNADREMAHCFIRSYEF